MFKRLCVALMVAVVSLATSGRPADAQDQAWVQIEARPTLREAEAQARAWAARLDRVNGFRLPSGWYAIALGPFSRPEAEAQLQTLLQGNRVPPDSYIVDGRGFGQRYWPLAAARPGAAPAEPLTRDLPVVEVFPDGTEPPPATDSETVGEALASEGRLDRDARARLQEALQAQGFYGGAVDAAFGPGTRSAMAGWQAAQGHEPTGVLTSQQRAELLATLPPEPIAEPEALQITVLPTPGEETALPDPPGAGPGEETTTETPGTLLPDTGDIAPRRSASGIYLNSRGDVATSLAVVAGCGRVTIDHSHAATVTLEDAALGLAVLRPDQALAPQGSAEFRTRPPAPQVELAAAGYSFGEVMSRPALSFGRLAALENDRRARLTLQLAEGDEGGPVLDESGAVLGMVLPAGTDARLLPQEVAYALPAAALAERLRAAGIPIAESERHSTLDPADLAALAGRITPLVSCWN
ncbi:trypsin-like peptidase domain-containing protein [Halodurantibacterium flavum]|uniref:Trypsin-like peptidase domain-containing protein n=1 Tax=Halodurantibacterium flavum TaxID=1382802 RepID=A0ABW4S5C4_9RHOB